LNLVSGHKKKAMGASKIKIKKKRGKKRGKEMHKKEKSNNTQEPMMQSPIGHKENSQVVQK